ncbi:MAG: helix-turn-helix transcriptional regulator [Vicinamibacteria bacterium]
MSARPIAEELGVVVVDYHCLAGVHAHGPEEWNASHNVAFVRRGVFALQTARTSAVADPNQVLFFNAHQPYRVAHPVAGGDDCTSLVLPDALARQLVARHSPSDADDAAAPFRFDRALSSPRATRLHYELLARARAGGALGLQDTLAELLDEALAGAYERRPAAASGRAATRRRDLAHAAAVAVQADLTATPSLADLAGTLGCSPFHLSRVFREQAGLSLRAYLKRLRARTAADHLSGGAPDLTSLALRLGYADHSHFTNAFRDEWGQPPSAFRARHH